MATLTIRLPADRHARLRQLARRRGVSVSKLLHDLSSSGLAQFEAEGRFRELAAGGSPKRALKLLDKVDAALGRRK